MSFRNSSAGEGSSRRERDMARHATRLKGGTTNEGLNGDQTMDKALGGGKEEERKENREQRKKSERKIWTSNDRRWSRGGRINSQRFGTAARTSRIARRSAQWPAVFSPVSHCAGTCVGTSSSTSSLSMSNPLLSTLVVTRSLADCRSCPVTLVNSSQL